MSAKRISRREILAASGQGAALASLAIALPGRVLAATVDEERVLRISVSDFAGNILDPTIGQSPTTALTGCMFDGWFPVDVNTGALTPGVIKKWEVSQEGTVWTLYLRDDVVFHDGNKMTADDIAFSMDMHQQPDAFQSDRKRKYFGFPPQIEKIDEYTLRITTPGPTPRFPASLSTKSSPQLWVLPKAYIEKNGVEHFRRNPVGSGPYKFVRLVESDVLEFEAIDYPHWSGVVPDFTRIIFTLVPEEITRLFQLEKGEIDYTYASIESAIGAQAKGFKVLTGAGGVSQMNFIGMYLPDAKDSPLADVRVREALSLAINRQELVDSLIGGLGSVPTTIQAMNLVNNVSPWLSEKWAPRIAHLYRYDPEEAERLLTEAGYGDGFSADVWTAPDSSALFLGDLTIAMASYWRKVGFNANVISVDSAAWRANRRPPLSMQLVGKAGMSATSMGEPVAVERLSYWMTDGGVLNLFVGLPDNEKKIDALWKEGIATVDQERYTQIVDEALEMIAPTYTCVPIINAVLPNIIGPRVEAVMAPGMSNLSPFFHLWKYTGKEN